MLASTKATLILVGRTEKKLLSVKNKINESGGIAEVFVADLRNDHEIQSLIQFLNKSPCTISAGV